MKDALPRTAAVLLRGIEHRLHLGVQLYVSLRGRVIADTAFGHSSPGRELRGDDLMLWMSAGKPLTAILLLQLVEQDLYDLDDRVAMHLPAFSQNGKADVTIRHLLTHTAGFRGPLNNFTPGSWDEILERVCLLRQEPGWVPGEKAGYHVGSSWFVIGELLRRARVPIEGNLHGFDDVHFSLDRTEQAQLNDRVVPIHDTSGGKLDDKLPMNDPALMTVPRPGATARGPIRSLGKLYERLLLGTLGLGEELTRDTLARQREGMLDHTFKQVIDWGLGFMLDSKQYGGPHQYGFGPHASAEAFGHGGNQSTSGFADPAHRLVVAWATNGMPGEAEHQDRANAINAAIYEDLGLA
jgi:CubicO group peptidase (beta-lactamase class C family)